MSTTEVVHFCSAPMAQHHAPLDTPHTSSPTGAGVAAHIHQDIITGTVMRRPGLNGVMGDGMGLLKSRSDG